MDLTPYVDALRHDLAAAAAAGTDDVRDTARLLAGAIDASARLCLVDALSAMAAEVTAAGDAGTVEIRMHGREPQVVVTPPAAGEGSTPTAPAAPSTDDDGTTARITLRLPESLKAHTEERAAQEGLSVNAWLVRAIAAAVHTPTSVGGPARGRHVSGFARS